MKNKKMIVVVLIAIILIVLVGILAKNTFCFNNNHKDIYPVNPCCTKCGERDGVAQHKCRKPNGKDKYCRVCGKILFNK